MMEKVDVRVAQGKFDELIVAALSGKVIWIVSDAQHAVQLVPAQSAPPYRQFGSAKGLITIAENFDAAISRLRRVCLVRLLLDTDSFLWFVGGL